MTTGGDPKPLTSSCEADRLHRVDISFVEPASSKGINQIRVKLVHKTKHAVVGETKFSWPEDTLPHQLSYDSNLGILEMKSEKNVAKLPVRIPKASLQIGLTKSVKNPRVVSWDSFEQNRKELKNSTVKPAKKTVKKAGILSRKMVEEFAFDKLYDFLSSPSVIVTEEVFTSIVKLCLSYEDASESLKMFAALLQKNMCSSQLTNEVRDKFTVDEVVKVIKWCSDLIMTSTDAEGGQHLFSTVIDLVDVLLNAYSQQLMWDASAKTVIANLQEYIKTTITACEEFAQWNITAKVTSEFPELDGEPPCDYVLRKVKLSKRVL
uniref:MIF4G domain-containing protein n=1 Tax=Steinernema glaseri TaxID=37863 RepID=A0A1I8AB05_9BILA